MNLIVRMFLGTSQMVICYEKCKCPLVVNRSQCKLQFEWIFDELNFHGTVCLQHYDFPGHNNGYVFSRAKERTLKKWLSFSIEWWWGMHTQKKSPTITINCKRWPLENDLYLFWHDFQFRNFSLSLADQPAATHEAEFSSQTDQVPLLSA